MQKFRGLLGLFVGTHSFHNYASTKGRQLKEVRKRVQASIDLKKAGGGPKAGGDGERSAPGEGKEIAQEGEEASENGGGGTKRWRSKEEWRTYRHKKKSTGDQKVEDNWYGKSKEQPAKAEAGEAETGASDNAGASPQPLPQAEPTTAAAVASSSHDDGAAERAGLGAAQSGEVSGDGKAVEVEQGGAEAEVAGAAVAAVLPGQADAAGSKEEGDGGPERVLMLRELRTK